ncbi:hypothetical protein HII31_12723 [Pseudocercospora fuligena]|uniref:Uncharacterized protein n=1 Tax=Pseudocercospora fuligena TaxID=685502 RepID=A0A8H6R5X6_9PEZI|nr:hypothetical protein HII31_12723 [Pseudocercospora fuligena]
MGSNSEINGGRENGSTSGIPIALCGKQPSMAAAFVEGMAPEYDVVHVCHNAPIALSELPALFNGEFPCPASGKGSNFNNADPRVPKAIFVGGGFTQYELNQIRKNEDICSVPMIFPDPQTRPTGNVPPPMDRIVARVKARLGELRIGKDDTDTLAKLYDL